jgi:hypothetical protein
MRKNLLGTKGRRAAAALAVTAAVFVPFALVGSPALAHDGTSASASQYQYRVTVCHLTGSKKHPAVTIKVAPSAVNAVLKGGGHLGPCNGTETPKPKHHGHS